jgi:hypothetical protein
MDVKENLKMWIEALESGRYKQTHHKLQDSQGFCCLGVAAEIKGIKGHFDCELDIASFDFNGAYWDRFLPEDFVKQFGLTDGEQIKLAGLNDSGWSFVEIAALLRNKLEYLENNNTNV